MPFGRRTLAALLGAAALPARARPAFPSRPLQLIVPFVAGGTTDIVARKLAALLTPELGQPVVVENRGGASGVIGTDLAARAAPDGHTLLLGHNAPLSIIPQTRALPYDAERAFAPITLITALPQLLVADARRWSDLDALLLEARRRPGALNFASGGLLTAPHLAGEMLKQAAGLDIVHVPYNGSAPAITALLAGQVDLAFDNLAALVPHLQSGRLRALGLAAEVRAPDLPQLPTMSEAGVGGVIAETWFGLLAPRETPLPVLARLSDAAARVLRSAEFRDSLRLQAATVAETTPQEFEAFLRRDRDKWRNLAGVAGLARG